MTPQELRRVTLEEYIEANGGIASFLEGLHDFAKDNGLDWLRNLQEMMTDVERRARLFRRIGMLLAIIVSVTAGGQLWHVRFDAGDYDSLVVITECKGKTPFYVYDQVPLLDIGQESADVRRQLTPAGERCTMQFSLMRPDESIGDSIIVTQED